MRARASLLKQQPVMRKARLQCKNSDQLFASPWLAVLTAENLAIAMVCAHSIQTA